MKVTACISWLASIYYLNYFITAHDCRIDPKGNPGLTIVTYVPCILGSFCILPFAGSSV
jgi:hypothetical protein